MYTLPSEVLDPRPGDTLIADLDGLGWQVIVVDHVVALDQLLPFGDRGSRRFIEEDTVRDSEPALWSEEVLLIVRLHLQRFGSTAAAAAAIVAGELDAPIPDVVLPAARLTSTTAILHTAPSGGAIEAERSS